MQTRLRFFHHARREQIQTVPSHWHTCHEIVYYLDGWGRTKIGEQDYAYHPGAFAVIAPQTPHDERHREPTEVMFAGFTLLPADSGPPLQEGVYPDGSGRPVLSLMGKISRELKQQAPYYTEMLDAQVHELLILAARMSNRQTPGPPADIIQFACSFIEEHFMQRIDFVSIAGQSGYSYDRFRHLFKETMGCSPTQYILRKRIEYACTLLEHTAQPVSAIAMECGFSNDAQFCSLFKRETGETPGAYRRLCARP